MTPQRSGKFLNSHSYNGHNRTQCTVRESYHGPCTIRDLFTIRNSSGGNSRDLFTMIIKNNSGSSGEYLLLCLRVFPIGLQGVLSLNVSVLRSGL